ncbi:hypothetical protein RND81_05G116300 [Saponaria officinalis]|uniref:Uncharacterized protein n=1 Tax=Saponaria officinalis TaxID=3572 RepID=A0AAW1KX15_SAPOF
MSIAESTSTFSSKKVVSSSSKSAYGIGYLHSFMRQMVGACHTNTNHGEHALDSSFNHVWDCPSIVDFFSNVVLKCWVYNLQDLIRCGIVDFASRSLAALQPILLEHAGDGTRQLRWRLVRRWFILNTSAMSWIALLLSTSSIISVFKCCVYNMQDLIRWQGTEQWRRGGGGLTSNGRLLNTPTHSVYSTCNIQVVDQLL